VNPTRLDAAGRMRRLAMIIGRCRTTTAARVVAHLAYLEDKHGQATNSRENIAKAVGRCERSVSRAIGELEAAGAVQVWRDTPRKCQDGVFRRRRTNLYRLKWPPKAAKPQVATKGHAMPVYAFHEAIEPDGGAQSAAPTPSGDAERTLFDLDPPPDPASADKPSPPPWIRLGMTSAEWMAAGRPDA
jgi:Helix-turn-helix domain